MIRMTLSNTAAFVCGAALIASSAACNREANREARGPAGAPISLTGCLQKGDAMNEFVLTQVSTPTRSVGTAGSTGAQPGAAAQEQMREAKHAYRLDGDNDELNKLVGKQVSVSGTIEESSDLNKRAADSRKDDKPANIDSSDLAKVKVKTIAPIADVCGER